MGIPFEPHFSSCRRTTPNQRLPHLSLGCHTSARKWADGFCVQERQERRMSDHCNLQKQKYPFLSARLYVTMWFNDRAFKRKKEKTSIFTTLGRIISVPRLCPHIDNTRPLLHVFVFHNRLFFPLQLTGRILRFTVRKIYMKVAKAYFSHCGCAKPTTVTTQKRTPAIFVCSFGLASALVDENGI